MDKRQIKQLVKASITNNTIDQEKVERIVALLTRSELKLYIHGLKNWIRQHTVVIEVPRGTSAISDTLKKQFEGKEVVMKETPSLLLGIRIQEGDDIYEVSLSNTLKQMENFLTDYE